MYKSHRCVKVFEVEFFVELVVNSLPHHLMVS
jgi:hypothetical protein